MKCRNKMVFAILALCSVQLGIADSISIVLTSSNNGAYHYAVHTPAFTAFQSFFSESFFIEGLVGVTNVTSSGFLPACNFFFAPQPPIQTLECSDGDYTLDNSGSNQPKNWGDIEVDAPGTVLGTANYVIEQNGGFSGSVQGPECANPNPLNGQCQPASSVPEPNGLLLFGTCLLCVVLGRLGKRGG